MTSKFGMRDSPIFPPRSLHLPPPATAPRTYEIEGDEPEIFPFCGEIVLFTWGDPHAIGGDTVELPFMVVDLHARGRVSGHAFGSAMMQGMGPDGAPVGLPPVMPYVNVPFSEDPRPLTWRHRPALTAEAIQTAPKPRKSPRGKTVA